MHYLDTVRPSPLKITFVVLLASIIASLPAYADIYRFVTIDGVETFTDAPLHKNAQIIVKDLISTKKKKHSKVQKNRDISINEVVEKTVLASLHPQEPSSNTFFEPRLPLTGGTITSGVGMRIDPIDGKWRRHNGIDIAVIEGTPIKAAAAGIVIYSGVRAGYGNAILIEHDNGIITLYGHNSRLMVSAGEPVGSDTIIALSGNTGRSTGPHLHFEAWQAGVNITSAFMPGSSMQIPTQLASSKPKINFRKQVLADGSVLFTNIPSSLH